MKIRIVVSVLIVLVVSFFVAVQVRSSLLNSEKAAKGPQQREPVVETTVVVRKTIAHCLELTGTAQPYRQVNMASPAGGPILNIAVREGDEIKAGELLLAIGRKDGAEALVASLQEELNKEKSNLERARQLRKSDAMTQEELEERQSAYEKVRAAFVKAQETEQDHTITAPWDGMVSQIFVKNGQYVSPHVSLLEIYDKSSMLIRSTIPERNVSQISQGMKLEVHLDAYPDRQFTGEIKRIYPYLDTILRSQTVEIDLEEPVPLLPGMFARLRLPLRTIQDAIVVPVDALMLTPDGWQVKILQDGKAISKPVVTGVEDGPWVEILDGLTPGEIVIIKGNDVKDGMSVKVREQPSHKTKAPQDETPKQEGASQ